MKVYAVVMEADLDIVAFEIVAIYKDKEQAIEKVADIMQEIEAYNKTCPKITPNETDEIYGIRYRMWDIDFPYQINGIRVDGAYVQEFELR